MTLLLQYNPTINTISPILPIRVVDPKAHLDFFGKKIQDYIPDGFKVVCDIDNRLSGIGEWNFMNIDTTLMFSLHRSWIYLIVVDGIVFKVGETAQPLGIPKPGSKQPIKGTKSRIGRYRCGDATDQDIRSAAEKYLKAGCKIQFWAKECKMIKETVIICGNTIDVDGTTQKNQEIAYLNHFIGEVGILPMWNKSKK